ncbi:MAG: glycerophosphodiester phosphodiesterase family protein [Bdellovibrionota bacterium]
MDFESGQEMIAAARRNSMQLWVYTVNDLSLFQKMSAYGADVVFTDNPAVGAK